INTGHEWTKWIEMFENFLLACDITADARKKALLLRYVGEEVCDIFRSLPDIPTQAATAASTTQTTQSPSTPECDAARAKLSAYFAPRVNSTFAMYKFRQAQQNIGEPLDAFYARLRQLSHHCNFENVDAEVQNQIILATTSSHLRKYAMLYSLTLPDLLKQGRMLEDVERDVCEIEKNVDSNPAVLAVHKEGQHHGQHQETADRCHDKPMHRDDLVPHQQIVSTAAASGLTKADDQVVLHGARHARHVKRLVTLHDSVVQRDKWYTQLTVTMVQTGIRQSAVRRVLAPKNVLPPVTPVQAVTSMFSLS
ncbi:uncharacterized protein, partial [Dermacentor andersoni]|uniref:uncharacterized protein n=1 Tax=Dermacentor andersoni TaxID=34620 RepID=UPI002417176B